MSRLMALDHGEKRIGVALSDTMGLTAQPHAVIERGSRKEDFAELAAIIAEQEVDRIVVGLPSDARSGIGPQAKKVIRWARKLEAAVERPISFWDESYSSEQAKATRTRKKRRMTDPIDDIAAALILQDYLDAGGWSDEPGQPLAAFDAIE